MPERLVVIARDLLGIAREAAGAAGELLLKRFHGSAHGVETKSSPTDPVSDADRDSERLIVGTIAAQRPDDGFLAEEGEGKRSHTGLTWVIDPLDGTVNYLYGIPVWCVSVAVTDETGTVAGVVVDPNRDETFAAVRGAGATLNGGAIRVSSKSDVSQALIGTGFAYDAGARAVQAQILTRVLPTVRDVRRAGSAALDLAALACGRLDGFYEAPVEKWDKAAGELLVREAGGTITEMPPPRPGLSPGVIAAGPGLHDALRALVLG